MKKSTLLMIVSVVLALTLSLGSTLAYLQDSDSDVNVMTLGSVYIEQHEYQRVEQTNFGKDTLETFEQNKPMYPVVGDIAWADNAQEWPTGGSSKLFDAEKLSNVVDKFVFVENTGKSDAYFRTIFAFELADGWTVDEVRDDGMIHLNINDAEDNNGGHYQWSWLENPVEIEGVKYAIATALYVGKGETHANGILPAGETSRPSLLQMFLDKDAGNDDIASLGDSYDVLVLSQAVQTAGFDKAETALDTAFGKVDDANKENANLLNVQVWMGEFYPTITATNADELEEALNKAAPGQTVALKAGEYGNVNISGNLEDVVITAEEDANVRFFVTADAELTNVTFKDIKATYTDSSSAYVEGGIVNIKEGAQVKNLVIEGGTFNGAGGRSCVVGVSEPSAEITLRNVNTNGSKYVVYGSAPIAKLTIEGCTMENHSSWAVMLNAGDSVGAELTINDNIFNNCTGGIAKYLGSSQPDDAFTVFTNNTLTNCEGHDGSDAKWFTIPGAASTITVSNNTLDGAEWTPGTAQGLGK